MSEKMTTSEPTTGEIVRALREHAEWAQANEWECPITLGDVLRKAADTIEELNDFHGSQCAKLLVRNGELERELEWKDKVIELAQRKQGEAERGLAAAKADLHHNDACSVCIGAEQGICKDCDLECLDCRLDCRCKDCRDESKWEWRGAREGEGK